MQWKILGLFLIAGVCLADIDLPPVEINKLDSISQIKEKCEKKTPNSYERVKTAINETKSCLEGKIVPTQIKNELDEAKKTGSMDEVFAKYCNKRQEYKDCIMKTVNATKDCMEDSEKTALDNAINVIEEIISFACFKDGDRLAMFVAEGGIECIKSRSSSIANCVNATLKINIDTSEGLSMSSLPTTLPTLKIDKKKCDDLAKIRECVVTDLENNCEDTTPANIVDALFKFINKSTCKKLKQKRSYDTWGIKRYTKRTASSTIDYSLITNKIAENCKENGGSQAINDFWVSLYGAQNCFGKSHIFITEKNEILDTLKNCTKDWINKAEACLSEELKFYPSFIIEVVESLLEFAYDNVNINKLSPQSEIVPCLQKLKRVGIMETFHLCITSEQNRTECAPFSIPNKAEICKKWFKVNECLANFVRKTCIRDVVVDRLLDNLTTASQRPCKNVLLNLS